MRISGIQIDPAASEAELSARTWRNPVAAVFSDLGDQWQGVVDDINALQDNAEIDARERTIQFSGDPPTRIPWSPMDDNALVCVAKRIAITRANEIIGRGE